MAWTSCFDSDGSNIRSEALTLLMPAQVAKFNQIQTKALVTEFGTNPDMSTEADWDFITSFIDREIAGWLTEAMS